MEIEYELNKEDLVEFNLHCQVNSRAQQKKTKSSKRWLMALASLFMIFAIVWIFLLKDINGGIYLIIGLFLIYAFWNSYSPRMIRRRLTSLVEEQNEVVPNVYLCKKKLALEAGGIHEESDFGECKILWHGISEISQTDKYLFLFETIGRAFIVPKRVFPDEDSFNVFAKTARDFRGRALNVKPKE